MTVIKMTGFWKDSTKKVPTHFLDFLNYAGVISYQKKLKQIKILVSPDLPQIPKNIYIDPARPFSNIIWIKRVLSECSDFIYWMDKHFHKVALDWLWSTADSNRIRKIRILSLSSTGNNNVNKDTKKTYLHFKQEMKNKGIEVIWSVIDSTEMRDSHDRWIIGGNNYLLNLPNVNAIASGQRSEINHSDNYKDSLRAFETYWTKSQEL
ncbi:MAG: hypothetical protein ACK4NC_04125 [Candidatus Gracilibacteria bacterium]